MMEEKERGVTSDLEYRAEILEIVRSGAEDLAIKERLQEFHARDIAEAFEDLLPAERERMGELLGSDGLSEIISYLDDASEYLGEIEVSEAADIIEKMDADEALLALEDLDERTKREILEQIEDPEVRSDIALLDSYQEDEFGSRMSRNFIAVREKETIKEVMRTLVREAPEKDNLETLFALHEDSSFYGAISLKDLIIARSEDELADLVCTSFPFVYDTDLISEKIDRLFEYDEELIPVLSSKTNALVGVLTANDIAALLDEERGEDYAKLAAMTAEHEPNESLFASMRKRVPWLIVLLFMGLAVSAVVGLFEGVVDALPMIVSFQSLILGMAGNVGTQSLAVTVRALGEGEKPSLKRECLAILRELRVALLGGVVLGAISFAIVSLYMLAFTSYSLPFGFSVAACVGLSMCFAMAISGFTGAAIPTALCRLGVDPAVASGPLITTVNDLVAVLSYYGLAFALLLKL